MKEPTGEKKADKDAVVEAITSLKARGADVNPYSVAAEADVCRASLVRNPELMNLLARARHNVFGNGRPLDGAQSQAGNGSSDLQRLQHENQALHGELDELRQQLSDSRAHVARLKQDVGRISEEAATISRSVNVAWQQGYLSGQQASSADHDAWAKTLVQNLAEAARAATIDSAYEPDTISGSTPALAEQTEPGAQDAITAYVADVPLHIEDPEVLNDPFTAKLLSALQGAALDDDSANEEADEDGDANDSGEHQQAVTEIDTSHDLIDERLLRKPVPPQSLKPPPSSFLNDQTETVQSMDAHPRNGGSTRSNGSFEDGADMEGPDGFTAEELHNLFRNKYVQDETGEPVQKAPPPKNNENSQSIKKFVGTNKASTAEPLPTVPRAFPPEIRKACRLLGISTENLSRPVVLDAWKREMAKPGVHPDTGGDTEMAIYLNTAKDTLMRWVEDQAPKLGKKFGQKGSEPKHPPKQE